VPRWPGALEAVLKEVRSGTLIFPVLLFDTVEYACKKPTWVCWQSAKFTPQSLPCATSFLVIGVIAGHVGCFGGMGIAAALCSFLVGTEIGRLGLNGPQVYRASESSAAAIVCRDEVFGLANQTPLRLLLGHR